MFTFALIPYSPLRRAFLALVASIGIGLLVVDTFVFAQYRFHINAVVVNMILAGQIVSFPLITWITVIGGCALVFALEWWMVKTFEGEPSFMKRKIGRRFSLLVFLSLLAANGMHVWAAAYGYQPMTTVKRFLPLYMPATANKFMSKHGFVDQAALDRQNAMKMKGQSTLNYPLSPLKTEAVEKPVNIMVIAVDSWRGDTFNADNTPNMWHYAQSGQIYNKHISTGNATRTGIFGLFYGLPGTYWHSFLANQRSPVLMDRLQQLGYNIGIFTAAQLQSPEFNRTVFANIHPLRNGSEGNRPSELDANLTKDWIHWYQKERDTSKPTFSFLFYDAPHGYDFPDDYPHKYEPMLETLNYLELNNETDPTPFMNRYKTSVHYVDSKVKEVLDTLKNDGDLENTVVIITGDHGQEANDNKLNFWGHNSNFTDPQVRVAFTMFGPGVPKANVWNDENAFTSHEDLSPTLMHHYLGVTSPVSDYSTGVDLLGQVKPRNWVMSSNYGGYAIIDDASILEVNGTGMYQMLDKTNRPIGDQPEAFSHMQKALDEMRKFSK